MVRAREEDLRVGRQRHRLQVLGQDVEHPDADLGLARTHGRQHLVPVAGPQPQQRPGLDAQPPDDVAQQVQKGALAGREDDRPGRDAGLQLGQERHCLLIQLPREAGNRLTLRRQPQPPPLPPVQRPAEGGRQLAHLDVQRGLGDVQLLGRMREVQVLGEGRERGEHLRGEQRPSHNQKL